MAQRLEAAARANKVLDLREAQTAIAGTHGNGNDNTRIDGRRSARRAGGSQRAHRRSPQRVAAAIGIAAVLAIGGGTAYATGTLARAADSLAAVFGAGPAQTELIDRIGRPIDASCSSGGITITADAIIGMRHAYAVIFSPPSASITYTVDAKDGPSSPSGLDVDSNSRVGSGDFTVAFVDGSTQEIGSGYTSWQQDGKTVVQKTWFFDQIHDTADIASITVGDLTVPIQ